MSSNSSLQSVIRVLILVLMGTGAQAADAPSDADGDKGAPSTDTPAGNQSLSSAESTWRALVEKVPDLTPMGLRQPDGEARTRVPRMSEVAPARRLCRYERDTRSSVMRRRCYTERELALLRRESQISSAMYIGGLRQ